MTQIIRMLISGCAFISLLVAFPRASFAQNVQGGDPVLAFPEQRTAGDPAAIDRGKQLYSGNCTFCHGSDGRGGETGPNLLRSEILLSDQNGETLAPVVQNGRPDKGMPKFDLSAVNVSDLAAFLHSLRVSSRALNLPPLNILVGDASAGKAFFDGPGKCGSCHSITGDLAGIGKRDPKEIQNAFVSGGKFLPRGETSKIPPSKVRVTLDSGEVIEGTLSSVDDFDVSLTDANENHRAFARNGNDPKVEITNPVQAHLDMLKVLTDEQVHNMTAYLATLK